MNNKQQLLLALSTFQISSTVASSDAHAMKIENGNVIVELEGYYSGDPNSVGRDTEQVICELKGLILPSILSIIERSKRKNAPKVAPNDTLEVILKKFNHIYSSSKDKVNLDAPGYYDEYPHKLPDYFAKDSCKSKFIQVTNQK